LGRIIFYSAVVVNLTQVAAMKDHWGTKREHFGRTDARGRGRETLARRDAHLRADIHNRAEECSAERIEASAALNNFTDQLQRAASLDDVYNSALDTILRALRCERASILLFDESGVMRFVAWRGLSDAYRGAVEGHSPWTPDEKDPHPICLDDVKRAGLPEPLNKIVNEEGIGSVAFIPLVEKGVLVGKFMMYYEAPHVFTNAEVCLAVTIARQLGFGVQRLRAEERLRAREAELQRIIDLTPFMLTRCSSDLRVRIRPGPPTVYRRRVRLCAP
jgi:GAF domain